MVSTGEPVKWWEVTAVWVSAAYIADSPYVDNIPPLIFEHLSGEVGNRGRHLSRDIRLV